MDEEGERAALRKEKRVTETGICPFRVSGSASASFLPGLTLFDGKRPSLFEERRGEERVGGQDGYIRMPHRAEAILRRFLPFVFPSKGFFSLGATIRPIRGGRKRGGDTRARPFVEE